MDLSSLRYKFDERMLIALYPIFRSSRIQSANEGCPTMCIVAKKKSAVQADWEELKAASLEAGIAFRKLN